MPKLSTLPGPHITSVKENLLELFAMDIEIFNAPPILFPFKKPEELLNYLTKDHQTITYIWNNEEGKLVGYFSYEISPNLPDMYELINLGIKPAYQKSGFGKKILEYFLKLIEYKTSRLVTHPNNKPARKLYEHFGYKPVKIIENYFGDGEPRLLFYRPEGK